MKLSIGTVIKQHRRERGITQEELSEILGVSCQSISRWELGVCYPEMELLPVIAEFFHITVDTLLGVEAVAEQIRVDAYLARFQKAISKGRIEECIAVAREGVADYPNNYVLLNKLMYALFVSCDSTGNIPDWQDNFKSYDEEITALGERIIKHCPDQNLRLEATARLAFHHCEQGRKAQGRALFETLPPQEYCREDHIWWALEQEEKLPHLHSQIQKAYDFLENALYLITSARLMPDQELLAVHQKTYELDRLVWDEAYASPHFYLMPGRCQFAMTYARLGRYDEALEQLRIAAAYAKAFDARPDSGVVRSLLIGEQAWSRTDFETADTRSSCEIMRDKWLSHTDFDALRERPAFAEILQMLTSA